MTAPPSPTTVAALLRGRAATHSTAPALLAPGRAPLDHGALDRLVTAAGDRLHALGIGRGHRVAVVLPNGPEMAAAFLAVAAHACAAPLNPGLREDEFAFHLRDMRADAVLVERRTGAPDTTDDRPVVTVAGRLGIPVVELVPEPARAAGSFTLAGRPRPLGAHAATAPGPRDTALLLHTSGTTARPKLVPLTQANLCAAAGNTARAFALSPRDRCLNVMPLFHAHGLVSTLLAALHSGGAVVCTPGFSDTRFFDWLAEYRPTWYSAVPAMHQALLAAVPGRATAAATGLRFVRSASAPLPRHVHEELENLFGAPVLEAYGMSEAGSLIASNPLPPGRRRPGSVGLPVGEPVAILDPEGRRLGPGQSGTVAIRGANVTAGYENAPDANREAFHEGWLRTGDEGHLDEDGYLHLTGRTKEIINRGGSKVSPAEIDEVLAAHPAVRTAVAFGVPHPTLGEDVAVAVVTRPGATAEEQDIREFAARRLAGHKVPSRVHFVPEVPRTSAGKVRRLELARRLAARDADRPTAAPRGRVAAVVAAVWADVLGREEAGEHDNFFDLGGDSLSLAKAAVRLGGALGRELTVVEMTMHPTVASLAAYLTGGGPDGTAEARTGEDAPAAVQARQRLLRQRERNRPAGREAHR
ncbi:non-ribosomal peptide synthetase [Streptomyces humi]